MADPQDRAEALDSDKLTADDDPDVEPDYPPDELAGADEYGITDAEELFDEPLDERVDREIVDPLVEEIESELDDEDRASDRRSSEPGDVSFETEDVEREMDLVSGASGPGPGFDAPPEDGPVGRLYEPGTDDDVTDFIDEEGDSVGGEVPADDLSAEEQAMHTTEAPPMGRRGGGYVD